MFSWYRLKYQKFPTLGLCLKFGLCRISVYSGFGLHGFHCNDFERVIHLCFYKYMYNHSVNQFIYLLFFIMTIHLFCILWKHYYSMSPIFVIYTKMHWSMGSWIRGFKHYMQQTKCVFRWIFSFRGLSEQRNSRKLESHD
jgi:hypothetical protein